MDILKMILDANGGENVKKLASQFGLDEGSAQKAMGKLVPALADGLKRNASSEQGLTALAKAVKSGGHARFLEDAQALLRPETRDEGNAILGHVLGSKDASRQLAAQASREAGVDEGVLKKILPLVATMVMGSLGAQSGGGKTAQPEESGLAGALGSLLGGESGGMSDLLGKARKLF